jgi:hypothetical protein
MKFIDIVKGSERQKMMWVFLGLRVVMRRNIPKM